MSSVDLFQYIHTAGVWNLDQTQIACGKRANQLFRHWTLNHWGKS